jgi:replicative DNA helicase
MIDSISEQAGATADLKKAKRRKPELNTDRLPPNSAEHGGAEQGVLGCILLAPNDCLPQIVSKFANGKEVFYDLRHQTIYDAIVKMWDNQSAIDIITLQQSLKDDGLLDQIGGIHYLNELQDAVPSAANISYYLDIVLEKFVLRQTLHTCTDIVGRIYTHEGEIEEFLDQAEKDFLTLGNMLDTGEADTIQKSVQRSLIAIEHAFTNPGTTTGITTGFADLDKMTDGLHEGEMFVIAARPSCGKTSIAMNIAEHVAIDCKLPVAVFSLEMMMDSLTTRMLCSIARVNLRNVKDGFLTESDFPKLTSAAGKLSHASLHIDDTSGLSILQLRARARRLWQQHGIKLFVIDYLQLLHSTSRKAQDNRVQEVSEISSGIKELAKELKVPIIVLSQLNRESEKNERRPKLSDLRESGAIEQDADIVGLLYKPKADEEPSTQEEADAQAVNLLIAKQRNGPTGDVHLTFLKPYTRFESAAKISDDDVPKQSGLPYSDN